MRCPARWIGVSALALVLLGAGRALADDPTRPTDLLRAIADERRDRDRRRFTLGRVRASAPQQISAGAGWLWTRQPKVYDCSTVCEMRGWVVEVEPGLAGAQVSAGYAVAAAETGRHRRWLSRVYRAYGVRGAVLRTWGAAHLSPPERTLGGVEGQFTVIGVSFSLGLFRPIGSSGPAEWTVGGGLGWGF